MEQGGEGGEGENMNEQPQPPPQQPMQNQLRCPRCDSLDTKFCYYNNYSLLQPRHFCKACKRYWTQGGTFRNIPVGGNSCKGKRAKSSSSSSRPQPQPLPQEVVHVQNHPNMTPLIRPVRPSLPMVVHSTSPYYQGGGGYLSSLSTVQSLNPTQPFNQSLNGNVVGSSNLSLPSSFNSATLGSQNHHSSEIQPSQFYHMENRSGIGSIYHAGQGLNASSVTNNSTTLHSDHRASNTSYWSTTRTTSISGNFDQNNIKGDSSSLIPNHWPNHPGCGPTQ